MSDALRGIFASDPVSRHFGDAALLSAMARFEAGLAAAQADAGLVPREAADAIAAVCAQVGARPAGGGSAAQHGALAALDALDALAALDAAALVPAARRAGTIAIPFVKALTDAVAAQDAQAARWVHFGATSQDVIDTALALQAGAAGAALLAQIARVGGLLAALADTHRDTMMTGRTLLQPAAPVPFGWKAACWLAPLPRLRARLLSARRVTRFVRHRQRRTRKVTDGWSRHRKRRKWVYGSMVQA